MPAHPKRSFATQVQVPARRAQEYREAFLAVITKADVEAIGAAILEKAKAGDLTAVRLLLDRILGASPVADWPTRGMAEHHAQLSEVLDDIGSRAPR